MVVPHFSNITSHPDILHYGNNVPIFESTVAPTSESTANSWKCPLEEFEQLKLEKDSMAIDLATCTQNLETPNLNCLKLNIFSLRSAEYFSAARRCVHTSTAPLIRETGLYGFDHLKTPRGFQRMVDDAIERSNELVKYIAGMPSGPDIIKAMDEISNAVCTVIDSAELCRHTHPDREFAEEASKASLRINEYLNVR
ncbi:Mitochondrial intermediate peptidase [Abeliophyllum distichum]|uniref:Mitochondrial intermediate peptidase n=1 Tax=Abeliophyllum distichum TaxID=126358 RepID=A0ABD1NPY7_9LAMI